MNKTNSVKCPPLTPDDIRTLRGKPLVKIAAPGRNSLTSEKEEWVYYSVPPEPDNGNRGAQERYYFKSGRLVGWKRTKI